MEEDQAAACSSSNRSSLCQECKENASKYKCPGCSIRTCSLPCVKAHKQRTNCNGKRSRTDFVPLSQFNDNLLLSDYNFLDETKRVVESAERTLNKFGGNFRFKMPVRLRLLKNAAGRRKIRLLFLPGGMSKREKNQSRYDVKKKSISWTVEWQFHATSVVLVDHGVDESASLSSVIRDHLRPSPWNDQLRPFSEMPLHNLKFFIRKNPKCPKSPVRQLDIDIPLSHQLADIVLIEHPTISVFLPSQGYSFEVEKFALEKEEPAKQLDDHPNQNVVHFREEEIEEDLSLDTQVFDLMKCEDPGFVDNIGLPESLLQGFQKDVKHSKQHSVNKLQAPIAVDNDRYYSTNRNEFVNLGGLDFEFAQDLRDAYSGLIDQVNPDDFLCIENGYVGEEELEEGEILEF